jgi:arabinofuranosyltransferase
LLLTLAALAATRTQAVAGWTLGTCVAALAWLRPELALACGALLASAALRDRRAALIAGLLAVTGAGALLVWRWTLFDDWLPLSARAKSGTLEHGVRYTLTGVVLATSLVGAWLAYLGARHGRGIERVFAAAVAAHLCAVILAGGDWMPGYRLLVPVLPLYAWLAAWGLVRTFASRPRAGALCLVLALLVPAADLVTRVPELHAAGASQRAVTTFARTLGVHARVVALVDVGYLAYASGVEVVDLGGLTDPVIARSPGGHLDKRIASAYLERRKPDALLLHAAEPPRVDRDGRLLALAGYPVERRIAALPFVRARFRVAHVQRYAPGYYYVLLTAGSGT